VNSVMLVPLISAARRMMASWSDDRRTAIRESLAVATCQAYAYQAYTASPSRTRTSVRTDPI
jgi:hypothetical protein